MRRCDGFKKLVVWQRAIELSKACYEIIRSTPRGRTMGIAYQLVDAARSVHANIAEGYGRPTRKDYRRFIGMALASLREVQSHLHDLEFGRGVRGPTTDMALSLADECGKMLWTLQRRLGD